MKYKVSLDLDKKSALEIESDVDGARCCLVLNKACLVVEDVDAQSEDEAVKRAREVGGKFLDMVCYAYKFAARIRSDTAQIEYYDQSGVRHVTMELNATIKAEATVAIQRVDEFGNVISDSRKPGKVPFQYCEAMSYFRKAQLSADSFDKFRNYYLAAENASSIICKQLNIHPRGDENLFITALRHTYRTDESGLLEMARKIGIKSVTNLQELGNVLYRNYRCALNHSKDRCPKKLPFNSDDERDVRRITPLMHNVAEKMIAFALFLLQGRTFNSKM